MAHKRFEALISRAGLVVGACLILGTAWPAAAGPTLDAVKRNGVVRCGVSTGTAGMSQLDSQGRWQGFDADLCRAVATAVFASADKIQFVPLSAQQRFTALQSGEVDVLIRTTALTLARDSTLGLSIAVPTFYTGQGFLVSKRLNAKSPMDLAGATICATQGSEIERNISDYARLKNIKIDTIPLDTPATVTAAFFSGRCDAISNDLANLHANRLSAPNPNDYVVLPDIIAKETHGALVRVGDFEWMTLVRWSVMALIQAEEFGLTRANVAAARENSNDPKVRRFLGLIENVGTGFGLPSSWAYEVVRQLGNYGEIFERHAGKGGLGMERGYNRLWSDGGLMISWLWQ